MCKCIHSKSFPALIHEKIIPIWSKENFKWILSPRLIGRKYFFIICVTLRIYLDLHLILEMELIGLVDFDEVMEGGRRFNLNSTNSYHYLTFQHQTLFPQYGLSKCKLKQTYKLISWFIAFQNAQKVFQLRAVWSERKREVGPKFYAEIAIHFGHVISKQNGM